MEPEIEVESLLAETVLSNASSRNVLVKYGFTQLRAWEEDGEELIQYKLQTIFLIHANRLIALAILDDGMTLSQRLVYLRRSSSAKPKCLGLKRIPFRPTAMTCKVELPQGALLPLQRSLRARLEVW